MRGKNRWHISYKSNARFPIVARFIWMYKTTDAQRGSISYKHVCASDRVFFQPSTSGRIPTTDAPVLSLIAMRPLVSRSCDLSSDELMQRVALSLQARRKPFAGAMTSAMQSSPLSFIRETPCDPLCCAGRLQCVKRLMPDLDAQRNPSPSEYGRQATMCAPESSFIALRSTILCCTSLLYRRSALA